MDEVKIIKGALDEVDIPGRGKQIVLRGVIDPETLCNLKTDKYQRERQPVSALQKILRGLEQGNPLPDIELAMRGTKVATSGKDSYILRDSVYMVDGLQRVTASQYFMDQNPERSVRLGCVVHFGTDEEWERNRFRILNADRSAVSGNVILRNMRHDNRAILTLWGLTGTDKEFPLYKRVSWEQNMVRTDILTGVVLAKTATALHRHLVIGGGQTALAKLAASLEEMANEISLQQFRENIKTFYELIEKSYGILSIQYRSVSPHMRQSFLIVLAWILSDHSDFWRGKDGVELFVNSDHRRKLGTFPITDPSVVHLCSASGQSRYVLYNLLRDHLNKGKRAHRLTPREKVTSFGESERDVDLMVAAE